MDKFMSLLDRYVPGRFTNALAYGLSFLAVMTGLAGLLWLIGHLTGGN